MSSSPIPGNWSKRRRFLLFEKRCVLFDVFLLFFRDVFERVNRVGRASRDAGSAIDAAFGIDIHLGGGFETGLIRLGMNAIGRANLNTEGIFDASISNYIGHDETVSWNEHFRLAQSQCKEGARR